MGNEQLIDALATALAMEEKGNRFYLDVSNKSKNNITKKTFAYLADNELLHIDSIKIFHNSLIEKGISPELDLEATRQKRLGEATLFSNSVKDLKKQAAESKDDVKACEFAMQLEKDGYNYYKDMLWSSQDKNLSSLLEFLIQEEDRHYQCIMDLHTFITDSQNWNMYEENSFPQG